MKIQEDNRMTSMPTLSFEGDATNYDADETQARFVPNRVWKELRSPVKHKILVGVPGSGKTIALKRISWPAMVLSPAFLEGASFAAFYCNMRDLEQLTAIGSSVALQRDDPSGGTLHSIVSYYGSLHILISILSNLIEATQYTKENDQSKIGETFLSWLSRTFSKPFNSYDEAVKFIEERQRQFFDDVYAAETLDDYNQLIHHILSPPQLAHSLALDFRHRRISPKLGFLLDQYEILPPRFQEIFNPLLRRETENLYFTTVGCIPYTFNPKLPERGLKPDIDFRLAVCEYLPDEEESYKSFLEYVWERLRPDGSSPGRALQGGLSYLSRASSRSVRRFLELCDACNALNVTTTSIVTIKKQRDVVRGAAERFQEALLGVSDVKPGALWRLIELVSAKSRLKEPNNRVSIAGSVLWQEPGLSGAPPVSLEAERLLKRGFEEGAFLFESQNEVRFISLPKRWLLAPLLEAVLESDVNHKREIHLPVRDLENLAALSRSGQSTSVDLAPLGKVKRVFLSLSFKNIAQQRAAEAEFGRAFRQHGVMVVTGQSSGAAMISEIAEVIQDTDFTILDTTHLSPNIVLEMGLTYGIGHRMYPIAEADHKGEFSIDDFSFLLNLGLTKYALQDDLGKVAETILRRTKNSINAAQMFVESSIGRHKIRVGQELRSLCVFYPQDRRGIWKRALGEIQGIARDSEYKCKIVDLSPHPHRLSHIENLVWCICKSERVIIDTSGAEGPDLLGAFALGFSTGLSLVGSRKEVLRFEEKGLDHKGKLGMWPGNLYRTWATVEELCDHVREFLPLAAKRRRRR